ncbi:efflux RND transporter periplasmic adaptor subunit [Paraburkholderia tagetis]|uniref:Efflux RND transporter periplasmic adaptor subunit n=1 Tax=Paraburkholderia tagetis TaxID=2913261 RepID=A0A9X1UPB2_9BURK|nr:efflux RND transporter periplasmic adaptor subunit [Paraburkholderia tagetis]MCG5079003.1 efflux RND transporter periplasmic adaptor subunit [Paraburkholderia tagetis]
MKNRWIGGAAALAFWLGHTAPAQADTGEPSVLVTLTALQQGSLPRTINAYGFIQPSAAASRTMMAPTSATVGAVYVREGEEVAAGAPLLQLAPSPQTTAAWSQARSALQVAQQLAARTKQMSGQHLATAQQLADAQKSEADARANLAALEAQGAGGSSVVRAPFRAIVMHVSASPGTLASTGTPLVDLAKPDGVVLKVGVAPADAALIDRGNAARLTAVGDHRTWPGTVLQRGSMIDPATGLVPVEISLPADRLLPGEAANATIIIGETQGYVVPHTAILVDDHGNPYVVQANGMKARKVTIRIADAQGDKDVIQGNGLNATQPLVLSGNHQLDDGMQIRVAAQGQKGAK